MSSYWDDKAVDPPKKRKKNPPVPISSKVLRIGYVSTIPTVPITEKIICYTCSQTVPPAQSYIDLGVDICLACTTLILADYVMMYGNPDA